MAERIQAKVSGSGSFHTQVAPVTNTNTLTNTHSLTPIDTDRFVVERESLLGKDFQNCARLLLLLQKTLLKCRTVQVRLCLRLALGLCARNATSFLSQKAGAANDLVLRRGDCPMDATTGITRVQGAHKLSIHCGRFYLSTVRCFRRRDGTSLEQKPSARDDRRERIERWLKRRTRT